jgi:NAD-dependent dihydropyrimidine dehydrogenase PreA subunit
MSRACHAFVTRDRGVTNNTVTRDRIECHAKYVCEDDCCGENVMVQVLG